MTKGENLFMKRIASFVLSVALLFTFATAVHAAPQSVSVSLDNEPIDLGGNNPIVEKGTTLVPAKLVLEQLDFIVQWDQENKAVIAQKAGLVLAMQLGSTSAYINDKEEILTIAPRTIDGTAYVPLRFISEAAGYHVAWDKANQTVALETKDASRGFMWKTEKNGNTVYLLGSIHVASTDMYPLRKEIMDAYKSADYLGVEADISKALDPAVQQEAEKLVSYSDGTTLKDHVSAETYADIQEILKDLQIPENAFDPYMAWNVSTGLDSLASQTQGFSGGSGIDMFFLQHAAANNKEIIELESISMQLKMFSNFSDELQEQMLKDSIANYKAGVTAIEPLSEMWKTGNEDQLLELVKATAENEELYKALLEDRNIAMVDKIEGYLNDEEGKTYFIVVGAAHMIGEHGLVPLLEKEGYTVTRQ
jgi:uncharacterized protein YbaP (TraB family)